MKKLGLLLLLLAVLAPPANADTITTGERVTVSAGPWGYPNNGGPFVVNGLAPDATPDFLSFCVERDEYINLGGTYYAEISTSAQYGGKGGPDPDPLDPRSAYLYSYFLAGSGWTTDQIAGLQLAIWRIEEEVGATYTDNPDGTGSVLGTGTQRALADSYYSASANASGYYGIQVMRLWGSYSNGVFSDPKQDLLISVPDGGLTLTLLGCALLGLGALRRKLGA